MKRYKNMVRVSLLSALLAVGSSAYAAAPELINFQGRVSDAAGVPLSGQYGVTFSVYDAQLGGNLLWSEHRGAVDVNRGLFSVPLGELAAQAPSTVFTGGDQWLEVQLDGDTPMVPRQRIGSVAYSFHANVADEVVNELDPTVAAEVKDGVVWSEVGEIPADFADGVDDVGLTAELDPTVPESLKDGVAWGEVADIPAGFADGVDDVGLTAELDPTVPESLKDGVAWGEVSAIPAGFADGVDNVGLTAEDDPQVGAVTAGEWCRGSGDQVVCDQPAPADTLAGLNCSVDQIARYDGSAWGCADPSAGGAAAFNSYPAKATMSANQNISAGVDTRLALNSRVYDDGGHFNTSSRAYIAPVSGIYHADASVFLRGISNGGTAALRIYRNSTEVAVAAQYTTGNHVLVMLSADIKVEAGDALSFYVKRNTSSGYVLRGESYTWANVRLVQPSAN